MSSMTRRMGLTTLGLTTVLAGLAASSESRSPEPRGHEPGREKLSPRQRIQQRHLPNVELVTHEGRRVRFYDDLVKDKTVAINFMYTNCADGTCPVTTANLVRVQKLLNGRVGRDIFFYSVSLTPEHDTPEVLRRYARGHGVGPGWWFLTGKRPDIERLRRSLGFAYADPAEDADRTNHVGMIRFGTEPLMIWGAQPGMANPEHLRRVLLWELDRPRPDKAKRLSPAV